MVTDTTKRDLVEGHNTCLLVASIFIKSESSTRFTETQGTQQHIKQYRRDAISKIQTGKHCRNYLVTSTKTKQKIARKKDVPRYQKKLKRA